MSLLTNIISYWKMEGNSNDSVGSSNGTDTNITYSLGNGKILQGAGYNGTDSKIIGSIAQPTSAYTISMWIKNGGVATSDSNYRLWDTQDPVTTTSGVVFAYNPSLGGSTQNLRVYHNNGSWVSSNALGSVLNDGNYHYVAVTWDGSTETFYVDGSSQGGGAYSTSVTNLGTYDIGHGRASSTFWKGAIDEVGIWSRALSSTEITQLYNNGNGIQYPFNNGNFLTFM